MASSVEKSNIAMDIVFSLISCGIYSLFWQARIFRSVNELLGEDKYGFWGWLLLSIITCGIYNIYIQYLLAESIFKVQQQRHKNANSSLGVINLILSIVGLHLVAMALDQNELNNLAD